MKVLIPDRPVRNVLAGIDSMTKKGITVDIAIPVSSQEESIHYKIKTYCSVVARDASKSWIIPSPFDDINNYLDSILNIISREKYDVIMPFSHGAVAACCYAKSKIEKYTKLSYPDFETFMLFHDKWQTFELCKKVAVPAPKTWKPRDKEELIDLADEIQSPAVIKIQMGCGISQGVRVAEKKDEILAKYLSLSTQTSFGFLDNFKTPIIQEYIEGPIHDVVGLFDNGEPIAIMSQKRVLTYPIDGGTGSVNETTYEPQIIEYACRLMKAAQWTGPAMCEFKKRGENDYVLLEVNPKFWGTLGLAIAAGLDIPTMTAKLFCGETVVRKKEYNVGLLYRWSLSEEIKSLMQYENKYKAVLEYIGRTFRRKKTSELKLTKPLRSFFILINTFLSLKKHGLSRKLRTGK